MLMILRRFLTGFRLRTFVGYSDVLVFLCEIKTCETHVTRSIHNYDINVGKQTHVTRSIHNYDINVGQQTHVARFIHNYDINVGKLSHVTSFINN